ncbi:MAG: hypothetical protein A2Y80_08485 [Deltaproteobacteria bacterium RBG_13_58_19]|nr:MAG: hypothetical protein A2Y80_08485 [Deltaproteobacteria bacterium RBG_13_58_19]
MLVFISDLHFVDGTAGEHNIPSRAFEYFFDDLVAIAHKPTNKIKEIKIVLLGDIFDLLRTENWFDYPVEERPWGHKEDAIEIHALTIFDGIVDHDKNPETFQLIKDGLKRLQDECPHLEAEPRLIYRPGNHDRLCNKYRRLRQKVCDCLGLLPSWHNPDQPFPHDHLDPRYGVLARHGHEFDKFNYEGGNSYTFADYQRVPIGDPITTELVARLPYTLEKNLKASSQELWPHLSEQEIADEIHRIERNFQEIENVRPFSAIPEWLLYQVQENRPLKEVIEDTVDEVLTYFENLDFVKDWYSRHDKWTEWRDEADQIQALLFILRNFKLYRTEKLWDLAVKAKDFFVKDKFIKAAADEYLPLDLGIRYVVYGHTHEPLVVPLGTVPGSPLPLEQVYLNTGTWRTRYQKATRDASFISWKNMTFVIFYREDERHSRFPVFESWTGTLKSI